MNKLITSLQNPLIRNILLLQEKPRERKNQGLFLVEGRREISLAITSGFTIRTLLHCPGMITPPELESLGITGATEEVIECSGEVYNRIAYRKDTGGVIAVAVQRRMSFEDLRLSETPLLLVLESVEKPGNLGAILRTADAAALDAVIICDPQTDIYNPNTVRSSIGCIFSVPVVTSTSAETMAWLKARKIGSCATALSARHLYSETDFRKPSAIIMGTEATGLSEAWLGGADTLIKIPMKGRIDSMNVSVSAAIVVFEALRQRNFR